jgi:hypothetical protein
MSSTSLCMLEASAKKERKRNPILEYLLIPPPPHPLTEAGVINFFIFLWIVNLKLSPNAYFLGTGKSELQRAMS